MWKTLSCAKRFGDCCFFTCCVRMIIQRFYINAFTAKKLLISLKHPNRVFLFRKHALIRKKWKNWWQNWYWWQSLLQHFPGTLLTYCWRGNYTENFVNYTLYFKCEVPPTNSLWLNSCELTDWLISKELSIGNRVMVSAAIVIDMYLICFQVSTFYKNQQQRFFIAFTECREDWKSWHVWGSYKKTLSLKYKKFSAGEKKSLNWKMKKKSDSRIFNIVPIWCSIFSLTKNVFFWKKVPPLWNFGKKFLYITHRQFVSLFFCKNAYDFNFNEEGLHGGRFPGRCHKCSKKLF